MWKLTKIFNRLVLFCLKCDYIKKFAVGTKRFIYGKIGRKNSKENWKHFNLQIISKNNQIAIWFGFMLFFELCQKIILACRLFFKNCTQLFNLLSPHFQYVKVMCFQYSRYHTTVSYSSKKQNIKYIHWLDKKNSRF